MALIIRAIVEVKINDILTMEITSIHFTKNLAKGGMPARLAITINRIHFIKFLLDSVFNVFIFRFFSRYIIIITDIQ